MIVGSTTTETMDSRSTAANIATIIAVTEWAAEHGADEFRRSDLEGIDDVPDRTVLNALERLTEEGYLYHEENSPYWHPAPKLLRVADPP